MACAKPFVRAKVPRSWFGFGVEFSATGGGRKKSIVTKNNSLNMLFPLLRADVLMRPRAGSEEELRRWDCPLHDGGREFEGCLVNQRGYERHGDERNSICLSLLRGFLVRWRLQPKTRITNPATRNPEAELHLIRVSQPGGRPEAGIP